MHRNPIFGTCMQLFSQTFGSTVAIVSLWFLGGVRQQRSWVGLPHDTWQSSGKTQHLRSNGFSFRLKKFDYNSELLLLNAVPGSRNYFWQWGLGFGVWGDRKSTRLNS